MPVQCENIDGWLADSKFRHHGQDELLFLPLFFSDERTVMEGGPELLVGIKRFCVSKPELSYRIFTWMSLLFVRDRMSSKNQVSVRVIFLSRVSAVVNR